MNRLWTTIGCLSCRGPWEACYELLECGCVRSAVYSWFALLPLDMNQYTINFSFLETIWIFIKVKSPSPFISFLFKISITIRLNMLWSAKWHKIRDWGTRPPALSLYLKFKLLPNSWTCGWHLFLSSTVNVEFFVNKIYQIHTYCSLISQQIQAKFNS
jgi:hypothetical protein